MLGLRRVRSLRLVWEVKGARHCVILVLNKIWDLAVILRGHSHLYIVMIDPLNLGTNILGLGFWWGILQVSENKCWAAGFRKEFMVEKVIAK